MKYQRQRNRMVDEQIVFRGISDPAVIEAMRKVPRHEFIAEEFQDDAYADHPLPIDHEQTISQPYIVAYMTEALRLDKGDKVLEIGTGCGYQTAILAQMGMQVYSVEIIEPLGLTAMKNLQRLGYQSHLQIGDGHKGWPEAAPFDGIIVTAAPTVIPPAFEEQLAESGRLVIPVGTLIQDLKILQKRHGQLFLEDTLGVRFVPMTSYGN